jgi:hypothetical protein
VPEGRGPGAVRQGRRIEGVPVAHRDPRTQHDGHPGPPFRVQRLREAHWLPLRHRRRISGPSFTRVRSACRPSASSPTGRSPRTSPSASRSGRTRPPLSGGQADGTCYPPTVITGVTPEMRVYGEESFRPLVSVVEVDGVDEAVATANDTEYGLSAAVWSANVPAALEEFTELRWITSWSFPASIRSDSARVRRRPGTGAAPAARRRARASGRTSRCRRGAGVRRGRRRPRDTASVRCSRRAAGTGPRPRTAR